MASYINVFYQPIEPYGCSNDGTTLTFPDLFGTSTKVWLVNPDTTTPTQVFSEEDLDTSFGQTFTDDFTATLANFTNTKWVAAGWTVGTFNTFLDYELVNWASINFPIKYRTINLFLYYASIGGTAYSIPIFYMGNQNNPVSITVGNQLGCLLRKKSIDMSNGAGVNQSIPWFSKDSTRAICAGYTTQGCVYVHRTNDLDFTYEATITEPTPGNSYYFGGSSSWQGMNSCAIDASGTRIVVGASNNAAAGTGRGAAYVYSRAGETWSLEQNLTPALDNADAYGTMVAISNSGDRVAISAPGDDDSRSDGGAIYLYSRSGTTWTLEQKITANTGTNLGNRNTCKMLFNSDGSRMCIPFSGGTLIYDRSGTTWTQGTTLTNLNVQGMSDSGLYVFGWVSGSSSQHMYYYNGTSWSSVRDFSASGLGNSGALSPDGTKVAVEFGNGSTNYKRIIYYTTSWMAGTGNCVSVLLPACSCNDKYVAGAGLFGAASVVVGLWPSQDIKSFGA